MTVRIQKRPSKKQYFYDSDTFEFLMEDVLDIEDITEDGETTRWEYLGQYATKIKPPKDVEEKITYFNTETGLWDYKDDNRGTWYTTSGEAFHNGDIDKIPSHSTQIPPNKDYKSKGIAQIFVDNEWIIDAEVQEESRKITIKEAFNAKIEKGLVTMGTKSDLDGHTLDADMDSILKLKGALDLAKMLNHSAMTIRTYDNVSVEVSLEAVEKATIRLMVNYQNCLKEKWEEADK